MSLVQATATGIAGLHPVPAMVLGLTHAQHGRRVVSGCRVVCPARAAFPTTGRPVKHAL